MSKTFKNIISLILIFSSLFALSASQFPQNNIPVAGASINNSQPTGSSSESSSSDTESESISESIKDIGIDADEVIGNPDFIPDEEGREEDPIAQRPTAPPITGDDDTVDIGVPPPHVPDTSDKPETSNKPSEPPSEETSGSTGGSSEPSSGESSNPSETAPPASESSTEPPKEYPDGWHIIDGKTYLYQSGKPLTGWQVISGFKYYFDKSGVLSSKVGIDVSYAQGNIDWNKVKAAGVDYVMIRVGYRGYTKGALYIDTSFERNIKGALAAGLDCGVYFFSQAITPREAAEEADFVLKAVKDYKLTYPIAFDTEYVPDPAARTHGLTDKERTDIAIAFCEKVLSEKYFPTIYASKSWLLDEMEFGRLNGKYHIWLAHYISQTNFPHDYKMWQYTDNGRISGITENAVDLNICLFDYPKFIKNGGYNRL